MKVIEVVELNENSVKIGEEKNPLAMRYFDDNGGLPSGNYDENDISGIWVHLEGKHTNFAKYAYRSIDNSTLIPGYIFKNYLIDELEDSYIDYLIDEKEDSYVDYNEMEDGYVDYEILEY